MIEHIVLASHGTLAEGIYRAASVILGEQALAHVEVLNCYVDETQDVAKQIADIAKRCHERSVVFTDLFGGSVNNQFYAYMQQQGYLLISGMNLPLLIDTLLFQGDRFALEAYLGSRMGDYMQLQKECVHAEEDF